MKKFVIRIFVFSLPILLCFIAIEGTLRNIPNNYTYKAHYIKNNAAEIETLILGNSHTFFGVNPSYMPPKTFNAAQVSQSLNYDYHILINRETNWKKLKKIYLPISYFTMWSNLNTGIESWRSKFYYHSYGIKENLDFKDYFFISQKFSTSIRDVSKFLLKKKDHVECNEFGWGTRYNSKKLMNLEVTGASASKRHTKKISSPEIMEVFDKNRWYLNEISIWAKKKEVEVVFFTPPAYISYINNLDSKQFSLTVKTINSIVNKHHNCKYINLINSSIFKKEDFYDADHLNGIGAKKLSELLTKL